jgi:UDP-glucose 4-epimerase
MTHRQVDGSGRPPVSLVTGGAGFIGSHVVDELLKDGHKVVALDDLSGGFRENVNEGAELVAGSVTDPQLVESVFERHKFDYVFHLAAYAAEGLSHFIRCFNYTNNVVGSMTVVNEAVRHECRCLVFTSSIAVYGAGQTPMTEELAPKPEDPYGIAKYAVELDLQAAHRMFGLNSIVFRPHNVYGERQNIGDRYRNVVGIFMNNILQNRPCTVFGDGTQTRAFTHISDVAPIIAKSAGCPGAYGQTFNIGADTPYSVNDLARAVQEAMGKDTGIVHLPGRDEVLHAFSDHSKCARFFGSREKTALDNGLKRMAAWVHAAGAREGKAFQNVEILRNMPPSWRELCSKGNR